MYPERDWGSKGVILCIIQSEDSASVKYDKTFSSQVMILNLGTYYSNRQVKDVAENNGWK